MSMTKSSLVNSTEFQPTDHGVGLTKLTLRTFRASKVIHCLKAGRGIRLLSSVCHLSMLTKMGGIYYFRLL